jgi:hypothetical protein
MCHPGVGELRVAHAIPVFGPAKPSIASSGRCFAVFDVVTEGRELVEPQTGCHGEDTLLLGWTRLAQIASRLRARLKVRGPSAAVVERLSRTLAVAHGLLAVGAPRNGAL